MYVCVIIKVVKGQCISVPVQLHSDPMGFIFQCQDSLWPFWTTCPVFIIIIAYTPESSLYHSLPLDRLIDYTYKPYCIVPDVCIPTVCPRVKALRAQDHSIVIKPLWLSGSSRIPSLNLILVRSSDRVRHGWAVLGSRITGVY